MKNGIKLFLIGVVFGAMLVLPVVLRADMANRLNVADDDEVHFHYRTGKHHPPLILKAAFQIREAKHLLWAADVNFEGHKVNAIRYINMALDELRMAEEVHNH